MTDQPTVMTEEESLAFAQQVLEVARHGDAVMLERLLGKGLPANLKDHKGDSLLMLASYHGHAQATEVLMRYGADPMMANDRGQLPIAGAAFKGDLAVMRALVEGGAPVDGTGADGRTALMMAAMFDRVEMIDYLLTQGADLQARDAQGIDAAGAASAMGAQRARQHLQALLG
ncbi:ankyrin repeat domain-containing protein [Pseudomonas sp. KNUC1026]|uniref:ankyrin repeat domain-containing protein n=1 Tax=Pseudomonas sp. KNUC1026 TaxID=2893890 RepID=UPI001F29A56F|nr:ankyrin repeat domain-containing protein [Pseudomonas sp. KNUC1026]UFH50866.1 ankyrin repeat domain-containing protein [Pseudomonas sp. KNUC1026]